MNYNGTSILITNHFRGKVIAYFHISLRNEVAFGTSQLRYGSETEKPLFATKQPLEFTINKTIK